MAETITKTGICDSCGNEKVVTATPHAQANNPKLWWYCEVCKFAHDKEKGVQVLLRQIASRNAAQADDPAVVAQLHEQVATQILTEKARNETLPANEQFVSATEPEVQEAEIVEELAPQTEPTPETVPATEETPAA